MRTHHPVLALAITFAAGCVGNAVNEPTELEPEPEPVYARAVQPADGCGAGRHKQTVSYDCNYSLGPQANGDAGGSFCIADDLAYCKIDIPCAWTAPDGAVPPVCKDTTGSSFSCPAQSSTVTKEFWIDIPTGNRACDPEDASALRNLCVEGLGSWDGLRAACLEEAPDGYTETEETNCCVDN